MSTLRVNTLQSTSTTDGGISIDTSGNVTLPANTKVGTQNLPSAGPLSNRNLIINGAMQVAQRGTSSTSAGYLLDRFQFNQSFGEFAFTVSQDSSGPDGFSNCFEIDVTTAETAVGSNETAYIRHKIEAQNLQHLSYGTSAAQQVTLSFWVRSSVTGTYACSLDVRDGDRNIGSTYTINSANTWEYKTITFAGDASGTINDDNGEGMRVYWVLGAGTDFTTTDNTSWDTYTNARLAYGHAANNFVTTVNSNFRITGVQLEVGSVATPFEHRSYGDELRRCQRYFYAHNCADTYNMVSMGFYTGTTSFIGMHTVPVPFRSWPSLSTSGNFQTAHDSGNSTASSIVLADEPGENVLLQIRCTTSSTPSGEGAFLRNNNDATATFTLSAEL